MTHDEIKEWLSSVDRRLRRIEIAVAVVVGLVVAQAGTGILGLVL